MNKSISRRHSKLRRKQDRKRLEYWKTTNLFVYKCPKGSSRTWRTLRTNMISRALNRSVGFLKLNGLENSQDLIKKWIYQFERISFESGILYASKYFKSIYSYCQRYAVSHKSEPIPFTKMNRLGVPSIVGFLTDLLRGTLEERRDALYILSLYKLVETNNEVISYKSISTPPLVRESDIDNEPGQFFDKVASIFPSELNEILEFRKAYLETLEEMFPSKHLSSRLKTLSSLSDIHISGKRGPNGPALSCSAVDFIGLRDESPHLYSSITKMAELTSNQKLLDILSAFEDENGIDLVERGKVPIIDSKLSLKQESGGKNRVFAIGDWFSQTALKGIHQYIFNILNKMPEDGTSDHNVTAIKSKEWCKVVNQKLTDLPHSVDLTTATDCVPSLLQREIVTKMFGKDIGNHWYILMTKRNFQKINSYDKISYTTGQPMGLLSSWALLALWHHVILQSILRVLRIPRTDSTYGFVNYLIIGDDVAMRGNRVYTLYNNVVLRWLNIPASELKGFTPKTLDLNINPIKPNDPYHRETNELVAVEIAKRIFVNGFEITPVSPVCIKAGLELPSDFPSMLDELDRRGYERFSSLDRAIVLSDLNFNPSSAISLASFPMSRSPQFEGTPGSLEDDSKLSKSPWLKPDWSDSDNQKLIKMVVDSLRNRLNTGISDVYSTIMPYMDYDCVYEPIQLKYGRQLTSQGLNRLFTYVYRKCQDLVTDWATDFSREGTREFWLGGNVNPVEFKKYLGRMHVIFDITVALEGTSQVLDEKRFSSKFLMEIVKDFLKAQNK